LWLSHSTWHGNSKGAGFHRTQWQTVEIDFTERRIRVTGGIGPRPVVGTVRPVGPGRSGRSNELDGGRQDLTRDREAEVRRAVAAWLRSDPGRIGDVFYSTGREDGYRETLNLITTDGEYTFRVNPQDTCGERNVSAAPREYQKLRNAVAAAVPRGTTGP
jgi:hypothetical protein